MTGKRQQKLLNQRGWVGVLGDVAVKATEVEMSMHDIVVHTPKTTLPLREDALSLSP
jgi:hypothetical protein